MIASARHAPDWVENLAGEQLHPCWTKAGHCWIRVQHGVRMRYPPNDGARLEPRERRELFGRWRALVISHHCEALPGELPNAYLYLCRDPGYGIPALSANSRSKVRRGLKRHEVRQITPDEMLGIGYPCVADTARRNGFNCMTEAAFRRRLSRQRSLAGRELWGALTHGELAAFCIARLCGRWAELWWCGSADRHLKNYPNNALFFRVLSHLLVERGVESVSYGYSSAQLHTHLNTLHTFKLSLGFEAVPVVRRFEVHPILRPAVNRTTRWLLRRAERRFPRARGVRKARGVMELLTGGEVAGLPAAPGTTTLFCSNRPPWQPDNGQIDASVVNAVDRPDN